MNRLVVHFGAMPPLAPDASLLPVSPAVLVSQSLTHPISLPRVASSPPEVLHRDVVEPPPMSDLFSAPLASCLCALFDRFSVLFYPSSNKRSGTSKEKTFAVWIAIIYYGSTTFLKHPSAPSLSSAGTTTYYHLEQHSQMVLPDCIVARRYP